MTKQLWFLVLLAATASSGLAQTLQPGDAVFITLRAECAEDSHAKAEFNLAFIDRLEQSPVEKTVLNTLKIELSEAELQRLQHLSRCVVSISTPQVLAPFLTPKSEIVPFPVFDNPGFLGEVAPFFNDPLYKKQAFLQTISAETAYVKLMADREFLKTPVKIGIIDEGSANHLHEDLSGAISAGSDTGRSNVKHGQYVLGIMAAQSGNKKGSVGVAHFNTQFTYRSLNYVKGKVNSAHLANTIREFGTLGMDAVNLSLAIHRPCTRRSESECYHPIVADPTIRRAIQETARLHGTIFVLSASNEGQKVPRYVTPDEGVLVVGNSTRSAKLASYSNHGPGVDLYVPDNGVYGLTKDGYSSSLSGTSFAAPVVAASAALIRHYLISHGIRASAGEVARHILRNATTRQDLTRNESSGLELNLGKAVSETQKIESFRR